MLIDEVTNSTEEYGSVEFNNSELIGIKEKGSPISVWNNTGVFYFGEDIIQNISCAIAQNYKRKETSISDILNFMAKNNYTIIVKKCDCCVYDIGTPENLNKARTTLERAKYE
jgi:NDP-sugar pyrophosphorylase family protein